MDKPLRGYYLCCTPTRVWIEGRGEKVIANHIRYYESEIQTDCGDAAREMYGPLSSCMIGAYTIYSCTKTYGKLDRREVDWVAILRFGTIEEYIACERLVPIFDNVPEKEV